MKSVLQWSLLKTRISLFTLAIFLISVWSLAFYANRILREDMQRVLGEQQFSAVSFMAAAVDEELVARLRALETFAATIGPPLHRSTADLQAMLEQRPVFSSLFNAGIFVTGTDGTATASIPLSAERSGVNYMDRDFMVAALKERKTTIGRPVMGKKLLAPIFVMAAPIRDTHGKVIGVLCGVTHLGIRNFLDKIGEGHYGKTGGYLLAAPQHNLFVTASDKTRIMQPLPARGINPMHDSYMTGYEGYGVATNSRGVEELSAAKRIPSAGWFVAAVLPTEEAFAPIRAMQLNMLVVTIFLSLVAGGLTWWLTSLMLRRQLSPLIVAAKALASQSGKKELPQPLPIARQDEIGELIGGFNRLLEILSQREDELKSSESRQRAIIENEPECITIMDPQGCLLQINPAGMAMMEADSPEQVTGMAMVDLVAPECRHDFAEGHARVIAGLSLQMEFEIIGLKGRRRWVEAHAVPLPDHGRTIHLAVTRDVTERKRSEAKLRGSEELFRSLVQCAPFGIIVNSPEGTVEYINEAFTEILGYTLDDLPDVTTWWSKAYPDPAYRATVMDAWRQSVLEQTVAGPVDRTFMVSHRDGRARDIRFVAIPLIDKRHLVTVQDITELKQAERDLRIAATAFDAQEGITITSAEGMILKVNKAFTEITGYAAEEVVGRNPRLLSSGRQDADFYAAMWECIGRTGSWQGELWNRRKSGEAYPEWLSITAVKGDDGVVTNYVGTFTDITLRKMAEDEIKHLAFFDHLTQLPNRRLMLDRLAQALTSSARHGRCGALMLIDLDNFKTLNDTLGHAVGDQLLVEAAARLESGIREGDTVARLGGDEFVVILEDLDQTELAAMQAESVATKILAKLDQPYVLDVALDNDGEGKRRHHCTSSIGITLFRDQNVSADELMKRADTAMYQAKAAGRNTLRFFDPEMQEAVKARATMELDMRKAIVDNQFVLHYQAQVDSSGRVIGAEALVRWQHLERGLVSPAEFIPLAEETGLILPLGHCVLTAACTQLAIWADNPDTAHLTLAVNVSARQFSLPNLVEQVLALIDHTGAPPGRLKLELTESLLLENAEDIIGKMTALKTRGVGFSMDDFGTGYSSLSYLKRLPLDQLKIDQSFVRDVLVDPNDAAIAKTVVALGQSLGLAVIAEGVETEGQRLFLAANGCHAYQGYLFSRPLPLAGFEAFLKAT